MADFSRDLVDLLTVREQSSGICIGDTEPYGVPGRLFGGHFVAQGLSACFTSIEEPLLAHSLHAYFHRTGDSTQPVSYRIETLRDGRSFASRRVVAHQADEVVFSMSASFKTPDEDEFFQPPMPVVADAQSALEARAEAGLPVTSGPPTAGGRVAMVPLTNAFMRQAELAPGEARATEFRNWLRVPGESALTPRQNQMLIGFLSDGPLPFCSVVLHGDPFGTHQHTSLDHALWFHRPADMRQWSLFDAASVATADGRGLNDGRLFSASGQLIASIRQESLMRRLRS